LTVSFPKSESINQATSRDTLQRLLILSILVLFEVQVKFGKATYPSNMTVLTWSDEQVLTISTSKPQHKYPHRRSCVHFAEELVTVHEVLHCQEYSKAEVDACWYSKSDYKSFKKDSIKTLQLWRQGDLPAGGNNEHSLRGLECRTREGAQQRKQVKKATRSALLTEIQRQLFEGVQDAQALADVYRSTCAPLQHQASIQGMCDEMEVRGYYPLVHAISLAHKLVSTGTGANVLQLQAILDSPSMVLVGGMAA
jgi:hypothetical protein